MNPRLPNPNPKYQNNRIFQGIVVLGGPYDEPKVTTFSGQYDLITEAEQTRAADAA